MSEHLLSFIIKWRQQLHDLFWSQYEIDGDHPRKKFRQSTFWPWIALFAVEWYWLTPSKLNVKICCFSFHMKCLSLSPDDHEYMRGNTSTWYCGLCVTQIFPLNTIEDDIFLCKLNGVDIGDYTIDSLSCRLFNPFQLNDKDYHKLIMMWISIIM